MKHLALLAAGALLSLPVFADTPGADWIPLEKAQQLLKAAGYTQINELKADDGQWEGEGLKADGMKYDFHLDPHSGKLTKEEMDM